MRYTPMCAPLNAFLNRHALSLKALTCQPFEVLNCIRYAPMCLLRLLPNLFAKCPLADTKYELPCTRLEGDNIFITVNLPNTSLQQPKSRSFQRTSHRVFILTERDAVLSACGRFRRYILIPQRHMFDSGVHRRCVGKLYQRALYRCKNR